VVVAGGGPAGFGAAIAAARNGANTLLVERYGFLGGMLTAGDVPLLPIHILAPIKDEEKPVAGSIARELVERLVEIGATITPDNAMKSSISRARAHQYVNLHITGLVMQDMVKENGAKLLLHTLTCDTIVEDNAVKGIIIENKSGRQAVLAHTVIDATGDGDVAARGGAEFEQTRGAAVLPATLIWRMGNVDIEKYQEYLKTDPGLKKLLQEKLKELPDYVTEMKEVLPSEDSPGTGVPQEFKLRIGYRELPQLLCSLKYSHYLRTGEVDVKMGNVWAVDVTNAKELSDAEVLARRKCKEITKFLKNNVPGFENSHLAVIATQLGVRESRRIIGEYVLTEDDVENGAKFDDIIARSRTGDKLHGRDGWTRAPFEIPYRCLVPKKLDGLLVAGRCISQTHGAVRRWSPRDILTCMATGTAAGTAAAFAAKNKVAVRNVDVKEVQNGLNLSL